MTDFPLIEVAMRLKEALRAIAFAQQALDGQDMTPRVKRLYDQLGVMEKMIDDLWTPGLVEQLHAEERDSQVRSLEVLAKAYRGSAG